MKYCEKCGKPLEDDEICTCEQETIIVNPTYVQKETKGMWKVTLTAVLYPAIAIGISFTLATSYLGLICSILLNVVGALCIYFGGFTLLVIPLPFIYFFRAGCIKRHLPLWKRIILGIVSICAIVGSILLASAL